MSFLAKKKKTKLFSLWFLFSFFCPILAMFPFVKDPQTAKETRWRRTSNNWKKGLKVEEV